MRDYAEQVKRLRNQAKLERYYHGSGKICDDAADAIEELLAKVTRWISVEEPPDNGRNIFICHGSADFKAPCIGHYEPNMKRFYEDKNWFASPIYDAMYWCEMPELPLPEPPKEDANENHS